MATKLHCMIDLETWGRGPTAQIISIGAVKFDPLDPHGPFENFHVAVDPRMPVTGLPGMPPLFEINPDTVMWWMSEEQAMAHRHWMRSQKLDLGSAIAGFLMFYGDESLPTWGNGATFDNVILSHAIAMCGQERPWKFTDDRCFRTLKNLFRDVPPLTSAEMLSYLVPGAVPSDGGDVPHTALYDAQYQAIWMRRIMTRLGTLRAAYGTDGSAAGDFDPPKDTERNYAPPEGAATFRCPRRDEVLGSIPGFGDLDWWIEKTWTIAPEATADGLGRVGTYRTCSYCGSLHPDEFMRMVELGAPLVLTSKNYKVYVKFEGGHQQKFYFQHLSTEQRMRFVELMNAGLNTGDYRFGGPVAPDPFFVTRRHPVAPEQDTGPQHGSSIDGAGAPDDRDPADSYDGQTA